MSLKGHLKAIVLFSLLQLGAMVGMPMRPEDIEQLLSKARLAKAEETQRKEHDERAKGSGEKQHREQIEWLGWLGSGSVGRLDSK